MSLLPRKRLRLASDSEEIEELKIAETATPNGEEEVLSGQVIVLVEKTNDSVDDQTMAVVKAYDLNQKKSHVLTPVTAEMIIHGLCMILLNDEVYVFIRGGKLFCLKDFWKEMASTIDFHDVSAVEMDGFLYVLGCETETHGTCEKYDPTTDRWCRIGITNRNSNFSCSVSLQGWIYAIGYTTSNDTEGNVKKFNPDTEVWENVASTKVVRDSIVATTLNGEIYVAGKDEEKNDVFVVEVYNPVNDVWTMAVFNQLLHNYVGLFTMDQTLLALRRKSGYSPCRTGVEIATLDFQQRKWVTVEKFEDSTMDQNPTLCCTMRVLKSYLVSVEAGKDSMICVLQRLTEKSEYFRAMFAHQFQEKKKGRAILRGVDSESMKLCIRHITEDYFPAEFDVINSSDNLFYVARMFLLDELVSFLVDYCAGKLCLANFQILRTLSFKYDLVLLEENCDEFAKKNLKELLNHDCFVAMELDYVKCLLQWRKQNIAACARIRPRYPPAPPNCGLTETDILKAVVQWVKYDEEIRRKFFSEHFLPGIDLAKVRLNTLKEAVDELTIKGDKKTLRKFPNAIKKRSRSHLVLLQKNYEGEFYAYFPSARRWRKTRVPPHSPDENVNECFSIGDKLYLMDKKKQLHSIHFTNSIGEWQKEALSPLAGENFVYLTAENGLLYAFGKNEAAKYDAKTNSWTAIPFHESRTDFAAVAYQDSIYIIGGRHKGKDDRSDNILNIVSRFNTTTEELFEDVSPMMEARYSLGAAQCCGKIFAFGGHSKSGWCIVAEEFDPVLNLWTKVSDMERHIVGLPKAVAVGQQIFIMSRAIYTEPLIYRPEEDTWVKKRCRQPFQSQTAVCISMPYDLVED